MTGNPIISSIARKRDKANSFSFTKDMIPFVNSEAYLRYQQIAWEKYEAIPYPSDKDEAWRRTNLNLLDAQKIVKNNLKISDRNIPDQYKKSVIGTNQAGKLILYPGGKFVELDKKYLERGVVFDDINQVLIENPNLVMKTVGKLVKPGDGKFSALASAYSDHGLFLYVPKGVKISEPLQSLFWNAGENSGVFSHHIIWLEEDTEATFIQEFASDESDPQTQFHAGILEVFVGEGSNLKLVELQSWGRGVWNIMHEKVSVQKDASLTWIFGSLGSRLTKSFSSIDLAGTGATAKVSGFYFADSNQHFDMDTEQNHNAIRTTSDLLYKGAVTESARSIWQGNIYVAPGADGTDGYQSNRNLILSSKSRADSIPGLEILADDVKCTHGATVGKVDPEQIFYLRSRGLNEIEAIHLIVEGFFETIMDRIPFEKVQERFRSAIINKIGHQAKDNLLEEKL